MDTQQQLSQLERLADALSVKVCYEPMAGLAAGKGGLCKVRGQYRVIIDRRLKSPERVEILAGALRRFDTEDSFVPPQVRGLLRESGTGTGTGAGAAESAELGESAESAESGESGESG